MTARELARPPQKKAEKKRSTHQAPTERDARRLRGGPGKRVRKVASEPDL